MKEIKTIPVEQFCGLYNVPSSFIDSLYEYDFIEIVLEDDEVKYIDESQIVTIEKLIRLHYDLDINFEGLDVITNLIKQLEEAQKEIIRLRNRLDFYER